MTKESSLIASQRAELHPPHGTGPRVSLVTGGTDGIGRAVALELGRAGSRVIFVGRDAARGAQVLAELEATLPGAAHHFVQADLALLGEAARVADEVSRCTQRLDAAVFCAGVLSLVPEWTQERLERSFVLNYLCRFLLVGRVLPLLRSAPSGRIVLVANAGKYEDTLDFDDLQHRRGRPGLAVSGRTQFANDLLAVELAERLRETRVQVSCVFPGVTRSSCFRNARGLPWFMRLAAPLLVRLLGRSPQAAARTPTLLATDAALAANGRFYGPDLQPIAVPNRAQNRERRASLWAASAELVRAFMPEPSEALASSSASGLPREPAFGQARAYP
jgi:NAD(P)-dependent dehydrogenase (short-subunit alcohol dehydrogenase family)